MSDLHVFETGEGPPIVLVHGMPSPPRDLEDLAGELPGHRVLVPHLPGYGLSVGMPGRHRTVDVATAVERALRQRGVEAPTLVGYSMGGYRVLALARRLGARSVLCLAGLLDLSADERAGMAGLAALLRTPQDVRPLLPPRYLSAPYRAAHPEADAAVCAWLDVVGRDVLTEELDDLATTPGLLAEVGAIDCPVLARVGALDVAVPAPHSAAIAAAAPRGALEIVPGVGHALLLEDRGGTVDAIRRIAAAG